MVDWNAIDKDEYLNAMKRSAVSTGELKYLLLNNQTEDLTQACFFKVWMLHIITKDTDFTRQGSYEVQVKVTIIFCRIAKTIGGAVLITLLMLPFPCSPSHFGII